MNDIHAIKDRARAHAWAFAHDRNANLAGGGGAVVVGLILAVVFIRQILADTTIAAALTTSDEAFIGLCIMGLILGGAWHSFSVLRGRVRG